MPIPIYIINMHISCYIDMHVKNKRTQKLNPILKIYCSSTQKFKNQSINIFKHFWRKYF